MGIGRSPVHAVSDNHVVGAGNKLHSRTHGNAGIIVVEPVHHVVVADDRVPVGVFENQPFLLIVSDAVADEPV